MDAIDLNKNLSIYEKYALHVIASKMDIDGDFMEPRWVYAGEIATRASMSVRQVFRVLASLEKRGYIHRTPQYVDVGGQMRNQATIYELTSKLFNEFAATHNVTLLRKPRVV